MNVDYEALINALIPEAQKLASKAVERSGEALSSDRYDMLWDQEYHRAMNRLAAEHGLRSTGYCQ